MPYHASARGPVGVGLAALVLIEVRHFRLHRLLCDNVIHLVFTHADFLRTLIYLSILLSLYLLCALYLRSRGSVVSRAISIRTRLTWWSDRGRGRLIDIFAMVSIDNDSNGWREEEKVGTERRCQASQLAPVL